MAIAVAYYSRTGTCEKLAKRLREALESIGFNATIHRVSMVNDYSKPLHLNPRLWWDTLSGKDVDVVVEPPLPQSIDTLIAIAPIWIARIAPPMRSFLRRNAGKAQRMLYVAVSRFGNYCSKIRRDLKDFANAKCLDVLANAVHSNIDSVIESIKAIVRELASHK